MTRRRLVRRKHHAWEQGEGKGGIFLFCSCCGRRLERRRTGDWKDAILSVCEGLPLATRPPALARGRLVEIAPPTPSPLSGGRGWHFGTGFPGRAEGPLQ